MPAGRPTKYSQKMLDKAMAWFDNYEPFYDNPVDKQDKDGNVTTRMERIANLPPFWSDLAKYLEISESTLYLWLQKHKEFSESLKEKYKTKFEDVLVKNGLLGNYNPAFAIFTAKNCLGWTDKKEVDNTHHFPDKIQIEFVEPKGEK
jgi:hypothetical protein